MRRGTPLCGVRGLLTNSYPPHLALKSPKIVLLLLNVRDTSFTGWKILGISVEIWGANYFWNLSRKC